MTQTHFPFLQTVIRYGLVFSFPFRNLKSFLKISLHFPFCFLSDYFFFVFHFMNLQEVEVNLIITDYCMPGMTGYDLLKKIKVCITFFRFFSSYFVFYLSKFNLLFFSIFPIWIFSSSDM